MTKLLNDKISKTDFFAGIVKGYKTFTIFCNKLCLKCLQMYYAYEIDVSSHIPMFKVLNTALLCTLNENCLNMKTLGSKSTIKTSKTNAFIAILIFLDLTVAI